MQQLTSQDQGLKATVSSLSAQVRSCEDIIANQRDGLIAREGMWSAFPAAASHADAFQLGSPGCCGPVRTSHTCCCVVFPFPSTCCVACAHVWTRVPVCVPEECVRLKGTIASLQSNITALTVRLNDCLASIESHSSRAEQLRTEVTCACLRPSPHPPPHHHHHFLCLFSLAHIAHNYVVHLPHVLGEPWGPSPLPISLSPFTPVSHVLASPFFPIFPYTPLPSSHSPFTPSSPFFLLHLPLHLSLPLPSPLPLSHPT
jgi:hypothetical protein